MWVNYSDGTNFRVYDGGTTLVFGCTPTAITLGKTATFNSHVVVQGQSYPDEVYQVGTTTSVTINWNNKNVQQVNMGGNCVINIDSGSNMMEGAPYTLIVHGHTSNTYTLQINGVTADMWIGADYSSATNHPNDTVSVFQFQKIRNRGDSGNLVYAITSIDQTVAPA